MVKIGDKIKILNMVDELDYIGRVGIVKSIDDAGQLHGTWGGLAVIPNYDSFVVVREK